MNTLKLGNHTSISTVIAEFVKQLRLFGADYVRSGFDVSKADPSPENQEKVAKALKITKAAYSKIENGDVAISIYHLSQLCTGYGISLGELMSCVDKKVEQLESKGVNVINAKLELRLDYLRWNAKVNEKAEANLNKAKKELKRTYTLYSTEQRESLWQECREKALAELEKKYDLSEAISAQEESQQKRNYQ